MLYYFKKSNHTYHFALLALMALFLTSCSSVGWRQIKVNSAPPAMVSASVAYNSNTQKAIFFGGGNSVWVNNAWVPGRYNETWEWNGESWKKLAPVHVPPAREKAVMAYDEARDRIVLFGGTADSTLFNDTWEWDGVDWQLMEPAHQPPARCCHAMTYDSTHKQVVLYGGWNNQANTFFNDVWLWDGKDWTEIPSSAPLMSGHFMVDFLPDSAVLSVQTANAGTWKWNGTDFSDMGIESPPSRTDVRAVYDVEREQVVLFGGGIQQDASHVDTLNDLWMFDGKSWTQVRLLASPSPRFGQVMFYDTKRESILMLGGMQAGSPYYLNDMWELRLPKDLYGYTVIATSTPAIP